MDDLTGKSARHQSDTFQREVQRQISFVARRAFRSHARTCSRKDVTQAFDISPAKASLVITWALAACSDLTRKERKVLAPEWAKPPHWAGEEDLLDHLESGTTSFADIGLTADELPIVRVSWRKNLPPAPGALLAITSSITGVRALYIQYTTIELGSTATWRRVLPIRLEQVNDHWRVTAHDLDRHDCALRTFALSRIVQFQADRTPPPKRLIIANAHDAITSLKVSLDDRMTAAQVMAMKGEFGIKNDRIELPNRSVHEFIKQFVQGADPGSKALWPPFKSAEVVDP